MIPIKASRRRVCDHARVGGTGDRSNSMDEGRYVSISVECYAGHRGEQTPRRFSLDGRSIEVVEVLDAWLAPDHRYFKIRGDDGACYILRNEAATGSWDLTMYDRTGTIGPKGT